VRLLIDLGRSGAAFAQCYADAVNPAVQGQDLPKCVAEVRQRPQAELTKSAFECGNPPPEPPPVVCSVVKDVLGNCLDPSCTGNCFDPSCTRIACDDGDPCTADFCDGHECMHIHGNDGAKCGPLNNPCMDSVCKDGKCGVQKANGSLCDPAIKCGQACFQGNCKPVDPPCKTGCFCDPSNGCFFQMTFQPCP